VCRLFLAFGLTAYQAFSSEAFMDDLFTDDELKAGRVSKTHPAYGRTIEVSRHTRALYMVTVSGGDLQRAVSVKCGRDAVNWVADALGRAPNPKP
jgi:hypothetical protein